MYLDLLDLDKQADATQLREAVAEGLRVKALKENSASFKEAVLETLTAKRHRSLRTRQDIRQTMNALMRFDTTLSDTPICELSSQDCERLLQGAYVHSPSRFVKARANLSGVFTVAIARAWCSDNPIKRVACPSIQEKTIDPMPIADIERLFTTAKTPIHKECVPALGLMLYAGVRPEEVQRMSWVDVDWEEKILYMDARHTKTGGGRHVPLSPPLLRLLKQHKAEGAICPTNWAKRWRALRDCAGFSNWVPDILRHSFASYHAKMYRDLPQLQLAMGHRDCRLLLTRYINMRGISRKDAKRFWQGFDTA